MPVWKEVQPRLGNPGTGCQPLHGRLQQRRLGGCQLPGADHAQSSTIEVPVDRSGDEEPEANEEGREAR